MGRRTFIIPTIFPSFGPWLPHHLIKTLCFDKIRSSTRITAKESSSIKSLAHKTVWPKPRGFDVMPCHEFQCLLALVPIKLSQRFNTPSLESNESFYPVYSIWIKGINDHHHVSRLIVGKTLPTLLENTGSNCFIKA